MFLNYIKVALRNLVKFRGLSLINILGLTVGLACCILIALWVKHELSFDKFHSDANNIYRVSVINKKEGKVVYDSPLFTPPLAPAMKSEFPEVNQYVRLRSPRTIYFSSDNQSYKITNIRYSDSTFFDIFTFTLLAGNPQNALEKPYSIVLTKETATKIYGQKNPIGNILRLEDKEDYIVTGVAEDPPANSHIRFNALISFSSLYQDQNLYLGWNGGNQYTAYIRLNSNSDPEEVNKKFPELMWENINKKYATYGLELSPYLQPLTDIHLNHNFYSKSLQKNLIIFSIIALLTLVIACINFINLTTARSSVRSKEVGIRKVLGSSDNKLRLQFILESAITTIISIVFALLVVELLYPVYKNLLDRELNSLSFGNLSYVGIIFILFVVVSLLAGSYPAFYLSSFSVIKTIKGVFTTKTAKSRFRNILVVFQFTISITLIIATIFINQQIFFIKNKNLGFNNENMLIVPLVTNEIRGKSALLKQDFASVAGVISVSASSDIPSNGFTSNGYIPEGSSTSLMIHVVDVDEDFLNTYDITLKEGRNFSEDYQTDKKSYLINESLAEFLNWEEPIGKTITRNGVHEIIGVVNNFNFATLHADVGRLIITNQPERQNFNVLSLKINAINISGTINDVEEIWMNHAPEIPFEYHFLDESFDQLYKSEQNLQKIVFYFSIIAIIIATMGLYSLASFMTYQRKKEIGIRKVLGATSVGLIKYLSSEYIKLVLLANIISWPIAWYAIQQWLQNFAYRIDIGYWIFLIVGCAGLLITLITVCYQAIKTAFANPIDALKYE